MKALLHITGPNLNREVALDPSGAELTLGRDPSADVPLADPQKHISRKHLALRRSGDGVELRIISGLNGIETSRGPAQPGQTSTLFGGDHFTLGPYRVDVEMVPGAAPQPSSASAFGADDPFAALLGTAPAAPRSDDPFARPEFRLAPAAAGFSSVDPFQQLSGPGRPGGTGGTGNTSSPTTSAPLGNFLAPSRGTDTGSPDLLASFGAEGRMGHAPDGQPLDDWLSGGTHAHALSMAPVHAAGPLDSFLGRSSTPVPRALSPDHVHGIHLPMSFGPAGVPEAPSAPSAPTAPPTSPASTDDMWADLLQGLDAPAGTNPAKVLEQTTLVGPSATAPPMNNGSAADDIDIPFGDDPFDDWADTASLPLGSQPPGSDTPTAVTRTRRTETGSAAASVAGKGNDATGAWPAFARGLGLPEAHPSDEQAAERAGVMVRMLIEGVAELLGARADLKRELRAEDRTMLSGRDNNPLKAKLSAAQLVQYLFAAQAGGGYMPAERAVRESIAELRVHEHATIAASRAAVEGALRDFEPGRLRKQLTKGKSGMFQVLDNARLWDAYQQHYEKQALHMADWLEAVFARHFMPTYARETERLKADESADPAA